MLSKIRNRREAAKKTEDEDDTKEFLLNRKVTIKEGVGVEEEYKIFEFLGSGKFGDVNKCQEKATGYDFAAKVIPYSCIDEKEAVMNEVVIMGRLRHPRLIQLYDVFVQPDRVTLIMELITGGELFERVIDENFELDEAACEKFMRQILQGVEYIHSQHVIHLDLKPENILCLSRTGFKIKIIDFGLAREVTNADLRVIFGTPEFVAPEIISFDPVTYATDMWSVGVVCYVLLSGLSPFMGDNESETLSNIMRCNYTFDYPEFKDISSEAKDFIRALLSKNPRKRNTATQCLAHPWLKETSKLKRTATVSKKRLRHFVYRRKWQKAVNAIIALQRMGVVLTHTQNKEPEYRKLLQATSTKTAALFRKSSVRELSTSQRPDEDMKRFQSFSTASETDKLTKEPRKPITQADVQMISSMELPPQITVSNPSQPEIKQPISNNYTALKPPSPSSNKPDSSFSTVEKAVNKEKSAKISKPGIKIAEKESSAMTKINASFKSSKFQSIVSQNNSPQQLSLMKAEHSKDFKPSAPTKSENHIKSVAPENPHPSTTPEKSTDIASRTCNKLSDSRTSPVVNRNSPVPRQLVSSIPADSENQLNSATPTTAPFLSTASKKMAIRSSNATDNSSQGQTPSGRSCVQPETPILLKMVALNKPRGSVAERISFFNNSPEAQTKGAKNKKFSFYS